jgi:methylenetetrahydrofolate dehydrogenase (NADP+) / methenyltetrahydrofolate cyclohydrolase
MAVVIMDGREVGAHLQPELRRHAEELARRYKCVPTLAAIVVGDDPASRQYVRNKRRLAEELGFKSELVTLAAADSSTQSLIDVIARLNTDSSVTGILLQMPAPADIDAFRLFDAIAPEKDVDAVGLANVTTLYRGQWGRFIPCTPRGVLTLLDYYKVPVDGRRAAVIGRSDIAGKPIAMLLGGRMRNATVTWCHRHSGDLADICRESDIVVSCAGVKPPDRSFLITADMIKPGACVSDVGFRRIAPGRFAGDVDYDAVKEVAGWVTPNPGGTGPTTVVALMQNLIDAARYGLGLERAQYSV